MKFILISFIVLISASQIFSQEHTNEYYEAGYKLLYMTDSGVIADVQRLIEKEGADVNFIDEDGISSLMLASQSGYDTIVTYLISKGAEINVNSLTFKFTPLISAVKNNYLETAEILIRNGALVDKKDVFERTALHYAAMYGFDASADMLLYYDANTEIKDVTGYTPICYSVEEGNDTITNILLNYQAKTDVMVRDSSNLFHLAAGNGNLYFLKRFVKDFSADKNSNGLSPVDVAVVAGQSEVLEWFLENDITQTDTIDGIYTARTLARSSGDRKTKKAVRKMKITDIYYPYFRRIGLGYDMIFNGSDFFMSIDGVLTEDRYGFILETGFMFRYEERRILFPVAENEFYQLREKRSAYYLSLRKNFKLFRIGFNSYCSAFVGIRTSYYFGKHDGVTTPVLRELKTSPGAGVAVDIGQEFKVYFYCDYLDLSVYDTPPLFYSFGVTALIDFRKKETNEKYKYIIKY